MPGFLVHHQLTELTQTHVHPVGDVIQPSHPLPSHSLPAFSLSQHRVFYNESAFHIWWPKYWSFSFSITPSNEHPGLTSFRMDWLGLCAVLLGFYPSSIQSLSHVQLFVTQWTAACQPSLSITNSQSLLKFMSIKSVMPSNHLILIVPFSSHIQHLPASVSFPMSQFFTSGGQSIRVSASA